MDDHYEDYTCSFEFKRFILWGWKREIPEILLIMQWISHLLYSTVNPSHSILMYPHESWFDIRLLYADCNASFHWTSSVVYAAAGRGLQIRTYGVLHTIWYKDQNTHKHNTRMYANCNLPHKSVGVCRFQRAKLKQFSPSGSTVKIEERYLYWLWN